MWGLPQKQNARRADKIRLCGHLRRYKKIVKKTYIIYVKNFNIAKCTEVWPTDLLEVHIVDSKLYQYSVINLYNHEMVLFNISIQTLNKQKIC